MSSLPMWREDRSWQEAEEEWDAGVAAAAKEQSIKSLKRLPNMVGISPETAKGLKWKALRWMVGKDHDGKVRRECLKHPLKYGWGFLRSVLQDKPYTREGDLFFYGVKSIKEFEGLLDDPNTLLVLGFSYCHKPFECPSGRFSPACIADPENPVCRQCFIGKARHALPPEKSQFLCIPTVHYISGKIFQAVNDNPDKKVIFIITACEMTLEMFGDWGNMVGLLGIGIRLDGRVCNTMKAFELSERGIKPGLTVVLSETQEKILQLIRSRRESGLI